MESDQVEVHDCQRRIQIFVKKIPKKPKSEQNQSEEFDSGDAFEDLTERVLQKH